MAAAWDGFPGGGSALLVLLALADWSDDDGRCWPSISNVADKSRLSRSQTQRVVHQLVADGHLVIEGNATGGPPGATRRYRIVVDTLTGRTRATGSADATGRTHAQDGSHPCAKTGSAHATQTISEPPVNRQQVNAPSRKSRDTGSAKPKIDPLQRLLEMGVDRQIADDFIVLRRARKAPITETVLSDLAREADKAGISFTDALRTCCARGWQSLRADWITSSGKTSSPQRAPTPENFSQTDYGQSGLI